jgi:hypothetical protein
LLTNLVSRDDLAASPGQCRQDLERPREQFNEIAVTAKLAGVQMELEGPEPKDHHRALIEKSSRTQRESLVKLPSHQQYIAMA